jgi:hypothetical protein
MLGSAPAGFPQGIQVQQQQFQNWSWTIECKDLWVCEPRSAEDVVAICNWAAAQSPRWQVRPVGIKHGWSPLIVAQGTAAGASVMLCDTTKHLTGLSFVPAGPTTPAMVRAGVGATLEQLLGFLEEQPGGRGSAPGFGFPHTPAPGHLSLGGLLAINAHGTAIRTATDAFPASYGSMSNQILAFTAVVSGPDGRYAVRSFRREDPDAACFLSHVGRAFLTEVSLQVVDNYNLRCQSHMDIPYGMLFQAPSPGLPLPPGSLASYLRTSGRVEIIWYPFSDYPWLKVWTVMPDRPAGAAVVSAPYNYPFSDNLPDVLTTALRWLTTIGPSWTPDFSRAFANFTALALGFGLKDLWGPSKNTLLYIKDTTLRVTANGYAIQLRQADVQQAVHDCTAQFRSMLQSYQGAGKYPVNAPLEIRVTGLDDPALVAVPSGTTAQTPPISSLTYDAMARQNGWDVALWFDVLTLPGTLHADEFYAELEAWLLQRFSGSSGRVLPEWSKGWAYTGEGGAWTSDAFLDHTRQAFSASRDDASSWNHVMSVFQRFDGAGLFSSPLVDRLFRPV